MTTATAVMADKNPESAPRRLTVLGATGSVGCNTLDLVGRTPEKFEIVALTANRNARDLAELAIRHKAEVAVVADPGAFGELKDCLSGTSVEATSGADALIEAASRPADWTMASIMGAAGLRPTFAAARQGGHIALANKECLVTAGQIFVDAVGKSGAVLLPVDSEHSAAFQALGDSAGEGVERITLTASGGPFRTWSVEEMARARPEDALKHPNWSMGQKLTIDSATLMNKGLELIEAYHLFPVETGQLDVVIHPQSIIHCLVEYSDGSVLAQMSMPDMRTPIAYSLAYPDRMWAPTERLNFANLKELTFEVPDESRFPALRITREVLEASPRASAILNAANEIAVQSFLNGKIGFLSISKLVEATLERDAGSGQALPRDLDDILALDKIGRELATELLPRFILG